MRLRFVPLSIIAAVLIALPALVRAQETVVETAASPSEEPSLIPAQPKKSSSESSSSHSALQDSMTAEQFKKAGLDKLSPEELDKLNEYLKRKKAADTKAKEEAVEQAKKETAAEVTKKTTAVEKAKLRDVINSRVDGTFVGLSGNTVIRLEDGSMWKQADPKNRYKAAVTDHPMVAVIRNVFGYKMQIVGTPEFYVDPVTK